MATAMTQEPTEQQCKQTAPGEPLQSKTRTAHLPHTQRIMTAIVTIRRWRLEDDSHCSGGTERVKLGQP